MAAAFLFVHLLCLFSLQVGDFKQKFLHPVIERYFVPFRTPVGFKNMNVPQDRRSARELVRSITKKHGYMSAERLAGIPDPDLRREIEETISNLTLMSGSSVITYEQPCSFAAMDISLG